jgi:hypothetical protein
MRVELIAVSCAVAACASTPNFQEERAEVFWRTPVLCLIQASPATKEKSPEVLPMVTSELARRSATCTAQVIGEGARIVMTQLERERRVTQMVKQENREAVSNAADKTLQVLLTVGAAYAATQAMQPPPVPPPRPIQCHTSYSYGGSNTTCQ